MNEEAMQTRDKALPKDTTHVTLLQRTVIEDAAQGIMRSYKGRPLGAAVRPRKPRSWEQVKR